MKGFALKVVENTTRLAAKTGIKIKKASPDLLIFGGALCLFGGTVLACVATKKAEVIIDDGNELLEEIEYQKECSDGSELNNYTDAEYKKAISRVKLDTTGKLIAAYGPAIALDAAGFAMIFTSHGIMKQRNGALFAAYNAVDAAFKSYRERVLSEDNGKELDNKYMFGEKMEISDEEQFVIDEVSRTDINKDGAILAANNPYGPYTFEYSRFTSEHWTPHAESNLNIIRSAEDWANRELRYKGHLFLNDVLVYLGMDKVPWGQLVGWLRGNSNGDSYVQILAHETQRMLEMDSDGWKKPVFLEFNCDGAIWEKL